MMEMAKFPIRVALRLHLWGRFHGRTSLLSKSYASPIICRRYASNMEIEGLRPQLLDFYTYLTKIQDRLRNGKVTWPPILLEYFGDSTRASMKNLQSCSDAIKLLDDAIQSYKDVETLMNDASAETDEKQKSELLIIAKEEKSGILDEIEQRNNDILGILHDLLQNYPVPKSVVFEVSAGVGGQEAMLFASELFDMYHGFCTNCGQDFEIIEIDRTGIGGCSKATANVYFSDPNFYHLLCLEGGIHRVQRIPATEKSGRVHTSTASVAILPVFDHEEIEIPRKDLDIVTYKKSSGPGGQHANKVSTAIRIKHIPSGKIIDCCATKSPDQNKNIALRLLKARLAAEKAEAQETTLVKARQQQVKNRERSDKIRTYNFNQDRITDHRIGFSVHNVAKFMSGDTSLINLMEKLKAKQDMEELNLTLKMLLEEGKVFLNSGNAT